MKHVSRRIETRWLIACLAAVGLPAAAGSARADVLLAAAPPPSWSLSLRSATYLFQTEDASGGEADEFRFYQSFAGGAWGLAGGRLSLRASGRFANAPDQAWPGFETSRLHTGYLEARLGRGLRARVGRQFLHSGVAGLTLDGAELTYGRRALTVSAWGGARAPWGQAFALGSLERDAAAGFRLGVAPGGAHRFAVSGAYRERDGAVAERPLGCEYVTTALRHVDALARVVRDLAGDRWARLELQGRWQAAAARPVVALQYVDRYPSVDAASWFARLPDIERIRLLRASARWERPSRCGGELEYVGSFVDTRASSRLGLALLLPGARIGYSVRLGDVGEESCFYGEAAWQARPWLRLAGEASYLTYALLADAPASEERDLTTLAARACARLRPGVSVTAEVQSLDTPLYSQDVRFLLGVDLAMARGTSRYGLDRGGWLP